MLAFAAPAQAAASLTGPTGDASLGGTVSFEANVSGVHDPRVDLICTQGVDQYGRPIVVFYEAQDVSRDDTTATFTLTSAQWTSGSADCQADLYGQKLQGNVNVITVYASVTFTASG
jgi:hypothetical protein